MCRKIVISYANNALTNHSENGIWRSTFRKCTRVNWYINGVSWAPDQWTAVLSMEIEKGHRVPYSNRKCLCHVPLAPTKRWGPGKTWSEAQREVGTSKFMWSWNVTGTEVQIDWVKTKTNRSLCNCFPLCISFQIKSGKTNFGLESEQFQQVLGMYFTKLIT